MMLTSRGLNPNFGTSQGGAHGEMLAQWQAVCASKRPNSLRRVQRAGRVTIYVGARTRVRFRVPPPTTKPRRRSSGLLRMSVCAGALRCTAHEWNVHEARHKTDLASFEPLNTERSGAPCGLRLQRSNPHVLRRASLAASQRYRPHACSGILTNSGRTRPRNAGRKPFAC